MAWVGQGLKTPEVREERKTPDGRPSLADEPSDRTETRVGLDDLIVRPVLGKEVPPDWTGDSVTGTRPEFSTERPVNRVTPGTLSTDRGPRRAANSRVTPPNPP